MFTGLDHLTLKWAVRDPWCNIGLTSLLWLDRCSVSLVHTICLSAHFWFTNVSLLFNIKVNYNLRWLRSSGFKCITNLPALLSHVVISFQPFVNRVASSVILPFRLPFIWPTSSRSPSEPSTCFISTSKRKLDSGCSCPTSFNLEVANPAKHKA